MSKSPAYQMYAQDFDMDTASWPNIAVGIYQRLLNYEWINKGLPKDLEELASIAREKRIIFERNWSKFISQKFHENGNGLFVNNRMELVRQDQAKYIESQRKKGVKSAEKRWGYKITDVNNGLQPNDQPEGKSSSSTSSSNNKEKNIKKRKASIPDEEWIKELQIAECYSHLNIKDQLQKCTIHFKEKNIIVSRQRFLNWLNNPRYNSKPISINKEPEKSEPILIECKFCHQIYNPKEEHQCQN